MLTTAIYLLAGFVFAQTPANTNPPAVLNLKSCHTSATPKRFCVRTDGTSQAVAPATPNNVQPSTGNCCDDLSTAEGCVDGGIWSCTLNNIANAANPTMPIMTKALW